MKAFCLYKNDQAYDHDTWNHWTEKSIISYHLTEEGVLNRIEKLIKGDNNLESYCIGTDKDIVELPIYDYYPIDIE